MNNDENIGIDKKKAEKILKKKFNIHGTYYEILNSTIDKIDYFENLGKLNVIINNAFQKGIITQNEYETLMAKLNEKLTKAK